MINTFTIQLSMRGTWNTEKIQPSESITFNNENMEHDRTCKESKNSLGEHDVTLEVLPCGDSSPDLVDSIDATGIFLSQHHQANAERKKEKCW